jgi:hypothetical protein
MPFSASRISGQLPLLPVEAEIAAIVRAYIWHQLMPANPTGDAIHLALASYHECDFQVNWNCLHLANANRFGLIRRVKTMLGLFTPTIATPQELSGGIDLGEGTD